jgi:4-hydroxybenzoate polyprenyltransferase
VTTAAAVESPTPLHGLAALQSFAADIKLSHSVFALPFALLAATLATNRAAYGTTWGVGSFGLVLLCMVAARTAAMGANRYFDASIDATNPRTRGRAIPAGRLSSRYVAASTIVASLAFLVGCIGFGVLYDNWLPTLLGPGVLAFLCAYPFLKRFTSLCHYYLGAALSLSPVCAWIAIAGSVDVSPFVMAAAVLCWTAGFDVIYATADREVDVATGVHSLPAQLGIGRALLVSRLTHVVCLALLVAVGLVTPELGVIWYVAVAVVAMLFVIEHTLVRPDDLSKVGMAFFTVNGIIAVLLGTTGIVDAYL